MSLERQSESERCIKIIDYLRENSLDEKPKKINKSDVMRHLEDISRVMTTHKLVLDLIKEGKIKQIKDKPHSQTHYLVINNKNDFIKFYNRLSAIDSIIDYLIDFKGMINSDQFDVQRRPALELNFVKPFIEQLIYFLGDSSSKIRDRFRSEKDRDILYKKNAELIVKIARDVQPSEFDKDMDQIIQELVSESKRDHEQDFDVKIINFLNVLNNFKKEYPSFPTI